MKIYILERRWIHKQTRARICYGKFGGENDERRNRVLTLHFILQGTFLSIVDVRSQSY